MLERIKKVVRGVRRSIKTGHFKKELSCEHLWLGTRYGGFYVWPGSLNENSIVYSFGIGEDVSFDSEIHKRYGCHVYGFDPTPKSIRWIKGQKLFEKFHFHEFGLSTQSGFANFFLPKNPDHVSGSLFVNSNTSALEKVQVEMRSLEDIVTENQHTHIDVLKIDIEGAEYGVVESILDSGISITQILIEFHDRMIKDGVSQSKRLVKKLKEKGYGIFAVSESFEEVSFVKRDRLLQS
ncbi:FkbM family methyltransferase [Kriegella aquimaris]|uniref:Methyltransferase, FkbM family n=1 Tax=Kriegella aquimaris TaxID=192904 RepID=A0A1G9U5B1_9FLAO|nr:FkbM family methyltransferase [Kriegella aquimaris]SDM55101.1 methyltransferase, FkbM family [Kriegella aquimaris]